MTGEDAAVPINAPGVEMAEYEVIAEPPTLDGAVNATEAAESSG